MLGMIELSGSNFSYWNEQILITLGCLNLDLALWVKKPPMSTNGSMSDAKTLHEKWEHSNQMSLIIMKSKITKNLRGFIYASTKAKEFLTFVEQ